MKLKVCGMREKENISALAALQPDLMGFIFYPKSKRFVGDDFQAPAPENIIKVGVFVNAKIDFILEQSLKNDLKIIQLHGDETPLYCREIRQKLPEEIQISKAFGVGEDFDFMQLAAYQEACDYFLFDTKTKGYGGSGRTFNWEVLKQYTYTIPLFLSGGIGPENLDSLVEFIQTTTLNVYAIDVNSRFETAPGLKDTVQLEQVIAKLSAKNLKNRKSEL